MRRSIKLGHSRYRRSDGWIGALALALVAGAAGSGSAQIEQIERDAPPATSPVANIPAPVSASGPVRTVRVPFDKGLFLEKDMVLRGVHAEGRVNFTRPVSWSVLPGSTLHLNYSHSGILLPDHSALTMKIGDQVKTVRLDVKDGDFREVVFPIDPQRLGAYNAVQFATDQHYTLECEDPFNEGLWTRIHKGSYFEFQYQSGAVLTDLAVFPYPFFDALAYPPARLVYVLPQNPSEQTATALANVTGALSQEVAYRPLELDFSESLPAGDDHAIVVGTLEENPTIGSLLSAAGIPEPQGDDGLVAVVPFPGRPSQAALVVTGRSANGVLKAGFAISDQVTRATFAGRSVTIANYTARPPVDQRDWPGFVPSKSDEFSLKAVGYSGETVRGFWAAPIRVDLKMPPDAKPEEFRQKVNVHYAYGSNMHSNLSTIEVQMNGVSIHSAKLNKREGSDSEWLNLELPWDVYGPFNRLELIFHLFPRSFKPCERVSDKQLWATVYDDSNVQMPKDYWMEIPDLAAFARWGYPFTIRADLTESAAILPDPANQGALKGLLRIVSYLRSPLQAPTTRLEVFYADSVPSGVLANRHLLVLAPKEDSKINAELKKRSLTMSTEGRVHLQGPQQERLDAMLREGGLTLEEVASPWAPQRVALILQESQPGQLDSLAGKLLSPKVLDSLSGSVAVISGDDKVNTLGASESSSTLLGSIPLARNLRYFFSQYWQFFLVLVVIGVIFLYVVLRRLLDRRRAKLSAAEAH